MLPVGTRDQKVLYYDDMVQIYKMANQEI